MFSPHFYRLPSIPPFITSIPLESKIYALFICKCRLTYPLLVVLSMNIIQIGGTVVPDVTDLRWLQEIPPMQGEHMRGRTHVNRLQEDVRRMRENSHWLEGGGWYDVEHHGNVNYGE